MNDLHITNAMENITRSCESRLTELYPAGIPESVRKRYSTEYNFLTNSHYIDDFELFRLLSMEARKSANLIYAHSPVTSSFIFYLLAQNSFNPMPAYYYCPHCGHYEEGPAHAFCIDLPPLQCPKCGAKLQASGFNCPAESFWGPDGKKEQNLEFLVSSEFFPFVYRLLQSVYPDNVIVPWGVFQISPNEADSSDSQIIGIHLSGYVVLPKGGQITDYPDLVSYLEDGTPCITGNSFELEQCLLKPVSLHSCENIDKLLRLQRMTGIYVNEISEEQLHEINWRSLCNSAILDPQARTLFQFLTPKTFHDMVDMDASLHNSFSWQDDRSRMSEPFKLGQMIKSDSFQKAPCFTREDFFEYMISAGMESELAFEASEYIRKGRMATGKKRFPHKPLPFSLPDEVKEVGQNYLYVSSRTTAVLNVLILAKLAYYAQIDSRAFSKVRYQKEKSMDYFSPMSLKVQK